MIFLGTLVLAIVHFSLGSTTWIWPWEFFRDENASLLMLRLPRVLAVLLGGASLGLAGAVFQGVFRNPIAEPFILGVNGGAAMGGSFAAVAGFFAAMNWLAGPLLAIAGGLLTLPLVMALGRTGKATDPENLLVGGVVLGSLFSALNTVFLLLANVDTNKVLRWLLGSATNTTIPQVILLLVVLALGYVILHSSLGQLHLLMASPESAFTLGVRPKTLVRRVLWTGTAMTAAVVGVMGMIGFVGLVAPHLARRSVGVDPRRSVPLAGLVGAALLCAADTASQRLGEIPVGTITALVGAPTLLLLLRRR